MATAAETTPQAFRVRRTVWENVEEGTKESERSAIRMALGAKLIQENQDLVSEVKGLLEVWGSLRKDSDEELRAQTPSRAPSSTALPEPPNLREWLLTQIRSHLENFAKEAQERGVALEQVVPLETPRDKAVFSYARLKQLAPSRPATAPSAKGKEAPVDTRRRGEEQAAPKKAQEQQAPPRQRTSSVDLQMSKSLPATPRVPLSGPLLSQDPVVGELRQAIEQENRELLGDVTFLRQCIQQETMYRMKALQIGKDAPQQEPGLVDIKEFNAKLEKAWLESVQQSKHKPPTLAPIEKPPSLPKP